MFIYRYRTKVYAQTSAVVSAIRKKKGTENRNLLAPSEKSENPRVTHTTFQEFFFFEFNMGMFRICIVVFRLKRQSHRRVLDFQRSEVRSRIVLSTNLFFAGTVLCPDAG